jgi:hypothetical protein
LLPPSSGPETLVNFYQTTRCYNPEDSNLHTHRRENLKSYSVVERFGKGWLGLVKIVGNGVITIPPYDFKQPSTSISNFVNYAQIMFLHFIVLLGKVMGQQMRKSWRRDVRKL